MTISIPTAVFDKYKEFVDCMIAEFGVDCLLYYPPTKAVSTVSAPDFLSKKAFRPSAQVAVHNVQTILETDVTESVRLRTYWTQKDFVKIADLQVPAGGMMTIGYLSDLHKVHKAIKIRVNTANAVSVIGEFERASDPVPWGLGKDRYFVCTWKRI